MTKHTKARNVALKEYKAKQAEVARLLKQIKSGLEEHDRSGRKDPLGCHWGYVGDLADIAATLRDIKDRLHNTGEYAEAARS